MGPEKKKQKRNTQTNIENRDFHSIDRRPSSQSKASTSSFSAAKSERPVKEIQKTAKSIVKPKKSKPIRKPTRAQLAKEDILYDTKKFDIVDAENAARPNKEKKRKKPSVQIRAVSVILVSLIVFFITAMLGIFIICKVDTIDVVGESIYGKEEIVSAADYHIGDNLFFLPIAEVEESLPKNLPYIDSVQIERKMPDKITIEVTACVPSAVFTYNDNYVTVGGSGKIIDIDKENNTSIMQVSGVEIEEPTLCEPVQIVDTAQNTAFYEIITQIDALSAQSEMTALDLTDTSNILLTYQDRVKMELGAVTKLAYKVKFGIELLQNPDNISETDYGRLNLTLKTDVSKVWFTPEYNFSSGTQQESTGTDNEGVTDSIEDTAEPFASNPGRGSDIPDKPYTGNSSASSSDESNDDNNSSSDDSNDSNDDSINTSSDDSNESNDDSNNSSSDNSNNNDTNDDSNNTDNDSVGDNT